MTYTLTTWALWLIAAALIGLVVGWLLGRIGHGGSSATADDPAADEPATEPPAPIATLNGPDPAALQRRIAELEAQVAVNAAAVTQLDAARADAARWRDEAQRAKAAPIAAVAPAPAPAPEPVVAAVPMNGDFAALVADRDKWMATAVDVERQASELRVRLWNAEAMLVDLRAELKEREAAARPVVIRTPAVERPAGTLIPPPGIELDDLTTVEGIGPRIAELCRAEGYDTWEKLAAASVADLQRMLEAAGPRFTVHDPSSWPEQAALLAAGEWEAFEQLAASIQRGTGEE